MNRSKAKHMHYNFTKKEQRREQWLENKNEGTNDNIALQQQPLLTIPMVCFQFLSRFFFPSPPLNLSPFGIKFGFYFIILVAEFEFWISRPTSFCDVFDHFLRYPVIYASTHHFLVPLCVCIYIYIYIWNSLICYIWLHFLFLGYVLFRDI